jgi:phosphonopyruvate decarboxylase
VISPSKYLDSLIANNINFFVGVPDSLLKQFCACVTDKLSEENHTIAANEGGAIGLAIGYHLGSGKVPMVYLQNSGLGNIINPLISLASKEVYGIPMVIMIGWRGEPGVKDEPQHIHQGRVMMDTLKAMDIPAYILDSDENIAMEQTDRAIKEAYKNNTPVVIAVRKNTFDQYSSSKDRVDLPLSREDAIIKCSEELDENSVVVCTTGMPSRELFEFRSSSHQGHHRDFLTVGGMGHASQIALGIASVKKDSKVFCFDGDGAALMHMGSFAIVGQSSAANLVHILFNNGVHDSVGGQPTVGFKVNFCEIAKSCGYSSSIKADKIHEIKDALDSFTGKPGPHFLEILVRPGNRDDIGRPTTSPAENKELIMKFLQNI